MRRFLVCGALVGVISAACLGGGPTASVRPAPHGYAVPAWLALFAAREARSLGDPSVRTALVAPITATEARLVFEHRRRAYPGHTYLVVLHGRFVSPRVPCPEAARGCPLYVPRLFDWEVMLAGPALGRAWRGFGIETARPLRSSPVALRRIALTTHPDALPTGRLMRFAMSAAVRMGGSHLRAFGLGRISAAQASRVFGGSRPDGYVVVESGIFRYPPGTAVVGRPGFSWAALEYRRSADSMPAAFNVLNHPTDAAGPIPGIRVRWVGIPIVIHRPI